MMTVGILGVLVVLAWLRWEFNEYERKHGAFGPLVELKTFIRRISQALREALRL